ncbi:nitrite reductase/ring-hydroxylating ferredoxin subunit [Methylohalomonas lacus]|uniref:Nitrite reductase/ring-hydroxylating ferredoxin subunit n=1 Tax=Methylohalomonas lacus TaxID=398773 RepID=A0AAE3L1K6_9GAMM|nr:Rieske 2Fe-2S domain-containing protein [Methylohalomonas lacus]MCS3903715.1 nitrite reductase/ring-hydroxylating ferredoxin subunit [Methylohalomonas lacus]
MKKPLELCSLDAIPDPGSRGFCISIDDRPQEIMVIRRQNRVYAYLNSCPHTGAALDWMPGEFLTLDQSRIICALHGAEFEIDNGYCVYGPCQGDRLTALTVGVTGNKVLLETG